MASTNSTVSGTVTFETDDDLSETNIGAADAQGNRVDYVERGCGFSVNHTNDTITIGSTGTRANYVVVENPSSHVAWHLYPDQDTDIALPNASATNHVFIAYDESSDAISYHIDDDDTAPAEPSLKIGTVDTANDTSTETNRNPDGTFETTTTGKADITDETYVEAHRETNTSSLSSGAWTNILDTEDDDNLDELNASFQFNPSETGKYTVIGHATLSSITDGDRCLARIRNVTDGTSVYQYEIDAGAGESPSIPIFMSGTLTSGKNYEIQAVDLTNSFIIRGNQLETRAAILRGVVHP